MEREEEKPKAFKVDDRRRFSSEGDLKPEFREGAETAASKPEPPPAAPSAEAPAAAAAEHSHAHAAHAEQGAHAAHAGHEHHEHAGDDHGHEGHDHSAHGAGEVPELNFGTFLVGLSTQALMHLGDIPDPQSGRPQQDLVAAQQLIDIIGMLELKTRGNLDREEAQLIDAILYELRMKYVERARTVR
jgi:hypothetical protein